MASLKSSVSMAVWGSKNCKVCEKTMRDNANYCPKCGNIQKKQAYGNGILTVLKIIGGVLVAIAVAIK